jgi:hypothetical protein
MTLRDAVQSEDARALAMLEINEAGTLSANLGSCQAMCSADTPSSTCGSCCFPTRALI